jgi:hypothetical protein
MLNIRVTVQFRFAIAACALLMASSLMGCKADSNYFAESNASIGSGDGTTADATVGFRVRVKSKTGVDSFMHKMHDINAACEVPLATVTSTTPQPTSIQCMMNMMEYDLWFYGWEYEVNVPAGACSFLDEEVYRYFKYEPGVGPSTISLTTVDGAITACSMGGVAAPFSSAVCVGAEASITSKGAVTCAYDYRDTGSEYAGPNCCGGAGTVSVTSTVNTTSGTPPTTTTTTTTNVSELKYGGTAKACTESPMDANTVWSAQYTDQRAAPLITELGTGGLLRSQKVPSVYSVRARRVAQKGNFYNAGFHDWDAYQTGDWDTNRVIPRAFIPVRDRGTDNNHTAAPDTNSIGSVGDGSYDFKCLGPAGEVKHRIRVYVNEWNTIEDYAAFKAGGDPTTLEPTRTGLSGTDCSAVNSGYTCNTIWGWDDIIDDTHYATSTGLSGNGTKDAYVFPYELNRPDPEYLP